MTFNKYTMSYCILYDTDDYLMPIFYLSVAFNSVVFTKSNYKVATKTVSAMTDINTVKPVFHNSSK